MSIINGPNSMPIEHANRLLQPHYFSIKIGLLEPLFQQTLDLIKAKKVCVLPYPNYVPKINTGKMLNYFTLLNYFKNKPSQMVSYDPTRFI